VFQFFQNRAANIRALLYLPILFSGFYKVFADFYWFQAD
jgi:hypothetical protein